jgi:periplasmic protein TonB
MGVLRKDPGSRLVAFTSIVALHAAMFWLVASGVGRQVLEVIAPPIMAELIEEPVTEDEPPPPPPPQLERPPVDIPLPVIDIQVPAERAIQNFSGKGAGRAAVIRVAPKVDSRASPALADYYPPAARQAGVTGKARVRTCVSAEGSLQGIPSLDSPSGVPALDEAAIAYAKAARFIRGTENGKAVPMCFSWTITFQPK